MEHMRDISPIKVFSFGPAWGLPFASCAPFPIKLESWLRLTGLPYKAIVENNVNKGPKKKSPWIEDDQVRMGDSELIIEYLKQKYNINPDQHMTPVEQATALAWQRMLEEHYHQVWEYFHFVAKEGKEASNDFFKQLPSMVRPLIKHVVCSGLEKQLYERGVGRHSYDEIVAMGISDINALANFLGDKYYFFGDTPVTFDTVAFAFISLTIWTPNISPVHAHACSLQNLVDYCQRMGQRLFPEKIKPVNELNLLHEAS